MSTDADGDGLPDAWELARFGNLNGNGSTLGANGQSLLQNYLAGTDPNNPNDRFDLAITHAEPNKCISFLARQASGAGYEGKTRLYALESTTNVSTGPWRGVPGRTNIVGNDATFTHTAADSGATLYFRGQARLTP